MKNKNRRPRFIAEWEPQSAVILVWPDESSDWHSNLMSARECYLQMIAAICVNQHVIVVVRDGERARELKQSLKQKDIPVTRVGLVECDYNDTWIRDFGPLSTIVDNEIRLVDHRFNAWGGKYESAKDDQVSMTLAQRGLFQCRFDTADFVLEGGALETNGHGTLLATRGSVITESRNPGIDISAMESRISETLGVTHFHWLEAAGLDGDDTDGHIDTLARFTNSSTIVFSGAETSDPNYRRLAELERELHTLRQPDGKSFRLIPLPSPGEHLDSEGRQLPATYANFLIINNCVLMPVYGSDNDHRAVELIRSCFPSRKIIPIDSRPLIEQNGSIHCATMQLAAGCFLV